MTKSNPGMAGRILNGRYELQEKIGEGGMALTWKARDLLLDRAVAVKIMRETLSASPQFITRFRQEAQAAASLSQEHVAAVHDFGSDEGLHYIVMEYVPGEDLRQRLRKQGALSPREALEIALQVAEALEAAHAQGIVHRDIKPANILLGEKNAVKVTDFGIARAVSGEDTGTDSLLGSVHYLSPEQARGEAVGPQADIYSLGAALFEMVTGRPPFQASNPVAVVHKHLYDIPPAPHSLRPDLPLEMESIILRCLDKSLANRYATAGELLNYLRALRSQLTEWEAFVPTKGAGRRPRWKKLPFWQKPAVLAGGALVLIVGALIAWNLRSGSIGASDKIITLPELVGMDLTSAQAVAENYGFRLIEGEPVYVSDIAKEKIARQLPAAGERLPEGATVQVQLSLGGESVTIPEVTEMREAQARGILEQFGLKVGAIREEFNSGVPSGMVIQSEPPGGGEVPRATVISLVVSKGPENPVRTDSPLGEGRPPFVVTEQSVSYTLPDTSPAAEVIVEALETESGRVRVLFRGKLEPGETLPPQRIPAIRPLTVRIKVNRQIVEERSFGG